MSNNKFKKGCKSEKIKELQKALGLLGNDVDGKWGNDTQTAMELKFPSLANGVTSSEIDKIKDKITIAKWLFIRFANKISLFCILNYIKTEGIFYIF